MALFSLIAIAILLAAVFYTVMGYPLVLAWMAKRYAKPVKKAAYTPSVAVVIAVYNGEQMIGAKLDSVLAQHYPGELVDVLVVSDGSSDRTEEIVRGYADRGVKLLALPRGGKPAALNQAIPQTTGEIVVLTDVRQELEPDAFKEMMACYADPQVGAVMGDLPFRQTAGEGVLAPYWDRERVLRKNLGDVHSMFGATGPFYSIRRSLVKPMPVDTLLDDMYLPLVGYFMGYRTIVEPRSIAWELPMQMGAEYRRKVRTLAGNIQIMQQFPGLLSPANPAGFFHFVSYKFARLLLPYEFLLIAVFSVFLPWPLNWIALGGQAFGYFLAAIDPVLPSAFVLRKISKPARTFVGLMFAALMAVRVLWTPPQDLWKPTKVVAPPKQS
jgi:cellulose synthase/poly-beta-1,6-N-acetylglucosamine synthase-like glycosyltransferase